MLHAAPLSPVPSLDCAYFPSPRGCGALCAFLATRLPRARLCVGPLATSLLFSSTCGLFISLCALFPAAVLYFQQLADSFAKTPGCVWLRASRSPLRELSVLGVSALSFPLRSLRRAGLLSIFNCRLSTSTSQC